MTHALLVGLSLCDCAGKVVAGFNTFFSSVDVEVTDSADPWQVLTRRGLISPQALGMTTAPPGGVVGSFDDDPIMQVCRDLLQSQ